MMESAWCVLRSEAPVPVGDRGADVVGGVLLEEVVARDGDLFLVGPRPAEVALWTGEDRAGVGVPWVSRTVGS